jgi:8-oxo-dGTP pyrophosphatase MutT (NUDIX family)
MRRAAAVAVIRPGVGGAEVLLVRRRWNTAFGGAWAFPGGAVEPVDLLGRADAGTDAAAAHAAVRELAEETGLSATVDEIVPLLGPIDTTDAARHFAVWFFAFCADRAIEVRLDEAELTAYRWFPPADALRRSRAGSLRVPPATRAALAALAGRVDALTARAVGPSTDVSRWRAG